MSSFFCLCVYVYVVLDCSLYPRHSIGEFGVLFHGFASAVRARIAAPHEKCNTGMTAQQLGQSLRWHNGLPALWVIELSVHWVSCCDLDPLSTQLDGKASDHSSMEARSVLSLARLRPRVHESAAYRRHEARAHHHGCLAQELRSGID